MSKEKALKSKTFCSALWTAIFQNPDGKVSPCCVWDGSNPLGNVNTNSLENIYTSERVFDLKNKMLDGHLITECNYCNRIYEESGNNSSREFFNNQYLDKIEWDSDELKFYHWDLRISNLCNFKCRMCTHDLSSEWYDDWKATIGTHLPKVIKLNDKSNFFQELEKHYKYVEFIYFAGGEPFINEHHFKILDDLVDKGLNKNIKLLVNTNLSVVKFKKINVLEYYKKFNYITFGFSIDGSYKVGEYIRKGLDYKKWKENVKTFIEFVETKNTEDIRYVYQFAYGSLNFHNIYDFVMDLLNDGLITSKCQFQFQPIMNPIRQSIKAIPMELVNMYYNKIESLVTEFISNDISIDIIRQFKEQLLQMSTFINNNKFDSGILDELYNREMVLDNIRNENLLDIIPDYKNLKNE